MLKHADRDNPVKAPGLPLCQVAIVDQFERNLVRNACLLGPLPRLFELLLAEGDAQHLGTGLLVQIKRHAAPATADVQDPLTRLQIELGGDMGFLVGLRLLQRHLRAAPVKVPIGTAILQVLVQKQLVEVVADIIMMRDVAFRPTAKVEPVQTGRRIVAHLRDKARLAKLATAFKRPVCPQQLDQLHDVALLDDQAAIHECLGRPETRIQQDLPYHAFVAQPDCDVRIALCRCSETFSRSVSMYDPKRAFLHDALQEFAQYRHIFAPAGTDSR